MSPLRKKIIIKMLLEKQKRRCCYCEGELMYRTGQRVPRQRLATIEHLRRKCEGGTNELHNLAAACLPCNEGRGSVDWMSYKSYRLGEVA